MAFDIDVYKRQVRPVQDDDIDFGAFVDRPLSTDALRAIRFMCDIESYTVCYLRDMLLTPSHKDPTVTTFLTMWAYEEYWHGEVLAKVLDVHGIPTDDDHMIDVRTRNGWKDRVVPYVQGVLSEIFGEDFVALHMAWGAINEWSTYTGYARLMELEQHPVLTEILTRIMRQETRHVAFYASQARDRLAGSRRARKITRLGLDKLWAPVGSGVMPAEDTRHMLQFLMNGPDGAKAIAHIDSNIDKLPGLEGLGLVARASAKFGVTADAPVVAFAA